MNLIQQKALVLEALVKLQDDPEILEEGMGICANLAWELHNEVTCEQCTEIEQALFKAWPEYSGDLYYPVPAEGCAPHEAYNDTDNMWDSDTAYGQARWRLLNFMIWELTAQTQTSGEKTCTSLL
jgi:hypothetical protein